MSSPIENGKPSAAHRIAAFLEANPDGPLKIATGYASFSGLAWLADRSGERETVDVLIGDCGAKHFLKADPKDLDKVEDFLEREEVSLWQLEKGNGSRVHAKVWIADHSVLSGSANLTRQGLYRNDEAMGIYSGPDKYSAYSQVHNLIHSATPADVALGAYAECIRKRDD